MNLVHPLKWHGGKNYLSKEIVAMMPPHIHYVETHGGGLQVLLARDPNKNWLLHDGEKIPSGQDGCSEVVNDINHCLMNFWTVLASENLFREFHRVIEATPFSEELWDFSFKSLNESSFGIGNLIPDNFRVQVAVAFFIVCRQSLAGRMNSFTGVTKTRTRRNMNNEVSAWLSAVEGLPAAHERLKRVLIINRDALEVIQKHDTPDTFFYIDPPYLASTRTSPIVYQHEASEEHHVDLLKLLGMLKGKFILSGYRSGMYDDAAKRCKWKSKEIEIANHSAGGKEKEIKIEVLWYNY